MTGDDDTGEAMAPAEPEPAGAAVPVEAKAVATGAAKPAPRRVAARSTPRKAPAPATPRRAAGPLAPAVVPPLRPTTLAIDVGGTGLKASVLDAAGKLVAARVRGLTPHQIGKAHACNPLTL